MKIIRAFYFKIYFFSVDVKRFIGDDEPSETFKSRAAFNTVFLLSMLLATNFGIITSFISKAKWFNLSYALFFPILLILFFYFVIDDRYTTMIKSYKEGEDDKWFMPYLILTILSPFARYYFFKPDNISLTFILNHGNFILTNFAPMNFLLRGEKKA